MALFLHLLQFIIQIFLFQIDRKKTWHEQIHACLFFLLLASIHSITKWMLLLKMLLVLWKVLRYRWIHKKIRVGWFDRSPISILFFKCCGTAPSIKWLIDKVVCTLASDWLDELLLIWSIVKVLHCKACPYSLLHPNMLMICLLVIWDWKLLGKSWLYSCLWSFMCSCQVSKCLQLLRGTSIKIWQILWLNLMDDHLLWLWMHLPFQSVIWWRRLRRVLSVSCIGRKIASTCWLSELGELCWLRLSNIWILWSFCVHWIILFWVFWSRLIWQCKCCCTVEVWTSTSLVTESHCRWKTCIIIQMVDLVSLLRFC